WPREEVAALSGSAWLEFLDRTAEGKDFVTGAGRVLGEAAWLPHQPQTDVRAVLTAAENWIRHHDVERSC
ncbi:MAG TPA: DUF4381 domain-containing protein, partial [Planctomicrobium sp.]|nr:DUF4381 domain-containing protein [Planctomicrobium sp.]